MEAQENSLAKLSRPPTSKQLGLSSEEAIRQFLVKCGDIYGRALSSSLVRIWQEAVGKYPTDVLTPLFERHIHNSKFFPVIADIEPAAQNKIVLAKAAGEEAWERVIEIRLRHWSPDAPGGFYGRAPKFSPRVAQACRAAGVFKDYESLNDLHVWAKQRFLESFAAWDELEQSKHLLPEGEIKSLLTDCASRKALPVSTDYEAGNARPSYLDKPTMPASKRWTEAEEEISEQLRSQINKPKIPVRRGPIAPEELERQKQAILSKYATAERQAGQ